MLLNVDGNGIHCLCAGNGENVVDNTNNSNNTEHILINIIEMNSSK